ncbi:thiamine biosynthesis protein ThiS [Gordonia effusa NBRC 100432]|uniref:Thiamine biosynthesis protein ThiS n=1 Tax=Gordonia effusa NBRC 100432 TaxID=1077974 RepID=H0QXT2_9ACTN|nr:sulfur carrier protein ThiS [Gordonia effusa]GAB17633.1 thiamine biosynthesis protein ThiS [Gordonia effusa NBRC 100432]
MTITVNGDDTEVAADVTVAGLVVQLELPETGIAVAVDGFVVPQGNWNRQIPIGAKVDIVTAVQGG